MIWFTSDTHYGHSNIVKGTSKWSGAQTCRDFPSLEAHDRELVDQINKYVKKSDTLIHLGDWSFGGKQNIGKFLDQLNVFEIKLVYGNHDHHIRKDRSLEFRFRFTGEILTARENGYTFFCSHYKHHVWDKSHHGAIHLYGHSHGSCEHIPLGKSMDVGVDNAFKLLGEYRPFSINEIIDVMKDREIYFPDHHNKNTN